MAVQQQQIKPTKPLSFFPSEQINPTSGLRNSFRGAGLGTALAPTVPSNLPPRPTTTPGGTIPSPLGPVTPVRPEFQGYSPDEFARRAQMARNGQLGGRSIFNQQAGQMEFHPTDPYNPPPMATPNSHRLDAFYKDVPGAPPPAQQGGRLGVDPRLRPMANPAQSGPRTGIGQGMGPSGVATHALADMLGVGMSRPVSPHPALGGGVVDGVQLEGAGLSGPLGPVDPRPTISRGGLLAPNGRFEPPNVDNRIPYTAMGNYAGSTDNRQPAPNLGLLAGKVAAMDAAKNKVEQGPGLFYRPYGFSSDVKGGVAMSAPPAGYKEPLSTRSLQSSGLGDSEYHSPAYRARTSPEQLAQNKQKYDKMRADKLAARKTTPSARQTRTANRQAEFQRQSEIAMALTNPQAYALMKDAEGRNANARVAQNSLDQYRRDKLEMDRSMLADREKDRQSRERIAGIRSGETPYAPPPPSVPAPRTPAEHDAEIATRQRMLGDIHRIADPKDVEGVMQEPSPAKRDQMMNELGIKDPAHRKFLHERALTFTQKPQPMKPPVPAPPSVLGQFGGGGVM